MSKIGIDQDALEILKAQVKADEEANRLKQSEINLLKRREQFSIDEREATVKLRAEVERLVLELRELSEEIAGSISGGQLLGRKIEILQQEMADIERGLYAVLSRDLAEMRRSRGQLGNHIERREEKLTHQRNLEKLQLQAAQYGPLDVPLKIQNAIEAEKQKLKEIEE